MYVKALPLCPPTIELFLCKAHLRHFVNQRVGLPTEKLTKTVSGYKCIYLILNLSVVYN